MEMEKGEVYLTLSKLRGTGFKVKTPTAVASVRGTSFTVLSDNKGSKLSVAKGTVAVDPVKDGKVIENKSVAVETGMRTDYIDKKAVEKIIVGEMKIPVMEMTPVEKIEIQTIIKEIKIEEMPELSLEVKEEMKQETVSATLVEEKKEEKKEAAIAKVDKVAMQKQIEEEKKMKEAELKKQEEEKKIMKFNVYKLKVYVAERVTP